MTGGVSESPRRILIGFSGARREVGKSRGGGRAGGRGRTIRLFGRPRRAPSTSSRAFYAGALVQPFSGARPLQIRGQPPANPGTAIELTFSFRTRAPGPERAGKSRFEIAQESLASERVAGSCMRMYSRQILDRQTFFEKPGPVPRAHPERRLIADPVRCPARMLGRAAPRPVERGAAQPGAHRIELDIPHAPEQMRLVHGKRGKP